jgi:exodeoxyribonuclease V alpha subunit
MKGTPKVRHEESVPLDNPPDPTQGELGLEKLNAWLGNLLNPHAASASGYQTGARVVVTSNEYRLGVVNGDAGTVIASKSGSITVDFGGWQVHFSQREQEILAPAWALSIHRRRAANIPLSSSACTPAGPCIAQSRIALHCGYQGKEQVVMLGPRECLETCISNTSADIRLTLLPKLLGTALHT